MDKTSENLLSCLIEINQWELSSLPVVNTTVGRHVYFSIINELLNRHHDKYERSLKQVLSHPNLTDRAIRLKLREMEEHGWLQMSSNQSDKRSRLIEPTPELMSIIAMHSEAIQKIMQSKFILLDK